MRRIAALTILFAMLSSTGALAQNGTRVSLGLVSGTKGIGIASTVGEGNLMMVEADLEGVLLGNATTPGICAAYYMTFAWPVTSYKGCPVSVWVGPGATVGWIRDYGVDNHGIMFGLAAASGLRVSLSDRVSLDFGFNAVLGVHSVPGTVHDTKLKLYRNGYRKAWMPRIAIRRDF